MRDPKWRVEKIRQHHAAHQNSPDEYQVGWWYVTNDPHDERLDWVEFAATSWEQAIRRIDVLEAINA